MAAALSFGLATIAPLGSPRSTRTAIRRSLSCYRCAGVSACDGSALRSPILVQSPLALDVPRHAEEEDPCRRGCSDGTLPAVTLVHLLDLDGQQEPRDEAGEHADEDAKN